MTSDSGGPALTGAAGRPRTIHRPGEAVAILIVTGDPFIAAVSTAIRETNNSMLAETNNSMLVADTFTGTSAELLALVTPKGEETWRAPKGWPANPRSVTQQLRRQAPVMRRPTRPPPPAPGVAELTADSSTGVPFVTTKERTTHMAGSGRSRTTRTRTATRAVVRAKHRPTTGDAGRLTPVPTPPAKSTPTKGNR